MTESDDLIREFLIESHEGLDRLDQDLVELEQDPGNPERLDSIFRAIHTVKGTCGFLGLAKLESVSHVGENLLSRLRDRELELDAPITTALLSLVDAIREVLRHIEADGTEGPGEYDALIAHVTALNARSSVGSIAAPTAPADALPSEPAAVVAAPREPTDDDRRHGEDRRTSGDRRAAVSDSSLRVDVALVDKLMNLVGELVLARNQILQFTATHTEPAFINATQRLNQVTSELQEGVMKTRMQPIGNIWGKFPRVVRDLAGICGKQVRIEMEGRETDLDRTIVEAIKDPLTHIIRNAVDHGIETPEVRLAAGKPAEGVIRLRAYHEGGQINIEIADDGGGIAAGRVRATAIARGVLTAEQSARTADHDVLKFVFMPGFSTAARVTTVSGRGVGMDVVKTNIGKIGGTVNIQSVAGLGTTLRIRIPLTLAIIPALMVSAGGERFAIPQVNLLELVRLDRDHVYPAIESIGQAQFCRLRGRLLPLLHLHGLMRLPSTAPPDDAVNIVVLKADRRQFGLVVDAVHDSEEIVVKPLGKQLKGVAAFAGATIMGDGRIALILDALGLAQLGQVTGEVPNVSTPDGDAAKAVESAAGAAQALLVFKAAADLRMALPLSHVSRLEEVAATQFERASGQLVMQYRGEILPLVSLGEYFGRGPASGDVVQLLVCRHGAHHVGLIVERIVDIVDAVVVLDERRRRRGITGAAVLQQQVTDMLDVEAVLADCGVVADAVA